MSERRRQSDGQAPENNKFRVDESRLPVKTIHISGRLSFGDAKQAHKEIMAGMAASKHEELILDLSDVQYLDGAGIAVILDIEKRCNASHVKYSVQGLGADARDFLALVDREELTRLKKPVKRKAPGMTVQIGEAALAIMDDIRTMISFVGDATLAMIYALRRPGSVRWRDVLYYMERTGADALPIVGLISLLLGLILGFQAIMQLAQFGANIYTANLVGLSILRELGPLMTCILVAGRSGSAFAAEIGTMKVSEEVDALQTMGFDPVRFLVTPKVLALMLMVPLLVLYADIIGLIGGMIVGVTGGGLTITAYLSQSYRTLDLWDFGQGLVKSEAFAILIALVGCMRGFQVRGGAASVGLYTTSAVVSGIFLIIVADSIFTLIFQYYG